MPIRALRLLRLAAQAELLRLQQWLRRQLGRAMLAAGAGVFALAALAGLHVAGVLWLAGHVTPVQAVLIVVGVDTGLAGILGGLAARDVPGTAEREALLLRQTAQQEALAAVALPTLVGRLLRARRLGDLYDLLATALAAWLIGARR